MIKMGNFIYLFTLNAELVKQFYPWKIKLYSLNGIHILVKILLSYGHQI